MSEALDRKLLPSTMASAADLKFLQW